MTSERTITISFNREDDAPNGRIVSLDAVISPANMSPQEVMETLQLLYNVSTSVFAEPTS